MVNFPQGSTAAFFLVAAAANSFDFAHCQLATADDALCAFNSDTDNFIGPSGISLLQKTVRTKAVDNDESNSTRDEEVVTETDTTTTLLVITKDTSAAEEAGVSTNKAGDLSAFISALMSNAITIVICICIFASLRLRYPYVFSGNVLDKTLEDKLPSCTEKEATFNGWVKASMEVKEQEVIDLAGLDHWMLLEFCHMAMKILGTLAVPNLLIMGPCHMLLGGNRAGDDNLSKLGMANVVDGSYLYWAHAVVVWLSVIIIIHYVYSAMHTFLDRRFAWLQAMPKPRSNTVLVEGIPSKEREHNGGGPYNSDVKLKEYFQKIFADEDLFEEGGVFVIKNTKNLLAMEKELETFETALAKANAQCAKDDGKRPSFKDVSSLSNFGEEKDAITHYEQLIEAQKTKISEERKKIIDECKKSDEPNEHYSTAGFVTFKHRRDAEVALRLQYSSDEDEFRVSIPPDPSDVVYTDLMVDDDTEEASETAGWLCVAGLFFGYMPIIVGISSVASLDTLSNHIPLFAHIVDAHPGIAAVWDGLVGAMALTLMVSFLPTFLVMIFEGFFALRAKAWLQHKVQIWYYYFQVVFVLMVTAVGSSLLSTVDDLIKDPTSIFQLLATSMPTATHFYLNLYPAQWTTHSMVLMRYIPLTKFKIFESICAQEDDEDGSKTAMAARAKAEPEDQDYYGMGSRSARFTMMFVIGIVFCTLSPLMTIMALINFALCRLFYGYLFCYAEIVKADLGGVFFVTQCRHVLQGISIYIVLMAGVLYYRGYAEVPGSHPTEYTGPGATPGFIAGSALIYWWNKYSNFDRKFHFDHLPFEQVSADDSQANKRKPTRTTYQQPELLKE